MLLLTHILIALSSLVFTSYTFAMPSNSKILVSYGFVALTLLSGTVLVVSTGSHLLQACATGLVYTSIALFGIFAAKRKLTDTL